MKTRKHIQILSSALTLSLLLAGCSATNKDLSIPKSSVGSATSKASTSYNNLKDQGLTLITPTTGETQLVEGLSTIGYDGEYGFDAFLAQGGASSDAQVVEFLSKSILAELGKLAFSGEGFGCSTLSVKDAQGDTLFGRNFDWQPSNALIVSSTPTVGYASISTVNLDFLNGYSDVLSQLPDEAQAIASLYAPLDGMNEQGLCAAVLMIDDSAVIDQNSNKPDLTTTTTIRLLLDKAANVSEAIALLQQYDMHSSMGLMVHFALSDATGRSVVVEYVGNKMIVTETPVVTNFYLAEGNKNGIGSRQSHTRFELLTDQLVKTPTMDVNAVRDAMDSVSKDNFGEFESTEWSIVYNQSKGEVRYYHRENYKDGFVFRFQ